MLRLVHAALLVLACHPLTAAPASAQSGTQPEPAEPPPVTGPAGDSGDVEFPGWQLPGWSFTPSMAIGAVHDSNVALTSARADLGRTEGDWLFSIGPAGRLRYAGRRSDFTAGYRGAFRRHLEVNGLDAFSQRATLGFTRAMSRRWSLSVRNSFADAPTTDEVEVNGVPFRRNGSRSNVAGVGADIRLTKLTTLAARYDMTWVSFDRQDEQLLGGSIHGVRADVGRQVSRRLSLGGEYGYRTATLDGSERRFSFQDVGAVARYDLGPHTRATASTGLGSLHDRNEGTTRNGPYVQLGIAQRLPHMQVGGSFERQYVPSFGFGGASSSQQIRGYAQGPLGIRRTVGQLSLTWRRTNPFQDSTLEADTLWLRSTVSYAATPWSHVQAFYTYSLQDSIVTGGEVDRHRIGVQVVVSQPMRLQ